MNTESDSGRPTNPLLEQWGKIQSSLAQITGMSFTTLDHKGNVVAEAGETVLCRLIAESPEGEQRCLESCRLLATRSRRENRTLFFKCQAGLNCFAAPIRIDGRPVATVLGGRILEKAPDPEFFQRLAAEHTLPEEDVMKAVGELPLNNARSLNRIAELVEQASEVVFASIYHQDRTNRRLTLLGSLFQLGTDLSPEKNPHEIYALIVNTVSILFDVEGACLMLLESPKGPFVVKTAFGIGQEKCLNFELSLENDLVREVLDRRAPLITEDYHRLLHSGLPEEVRIAAFFPMLFGEEVRGILMILNTALEPDTVQLIFSFCNQASTAVQNTILRQELSQKIEEAGRLVRIQSRITPILDRDALLEAIFDEATKMAKAEQASLMLLNHKTNELIVKLARGEHSPVIERVSIQPGEGIAGVVAQRGEPIVVSDIESDRRFQKRRKRPRYRTGSFLIVPLTIGPRVIGVINLTDKSEGVFTEEDLKTIQTVVSQSAIALQRSELYIMSQELKKISATDSLTKLLNRRYFQRRSNEELLRAQRYGLPLSLMMLDLDDFKAYNDRHGHLAGDNLLVGVSRTIQNTVRSIDVVSRFGGEEFAILSPQTGLREAVAVAERVCDAVSGHPFPFKEQQPLGLVSISAGVSTFPEHARSLKELLDAADRALYRAKHSGKNTVYTFN